MEIAKSTKLNKNVWLTVILFGFMGQIAWAVENMYFNKFLFDKIGGTAQDIANMVMWSAIIATITTLVMGALSDKVNRRKLFICGGYIVWGLVTLCFAFVSRETTAKLFPNASADQVVRIAVVIVIALDCIMTFFGSTSNDAGFNAWVTDATDSTNRGTVEGVLQIFPLISMLIVAALSDMIIDAIEYTGFFILIGGIVSICGIVGLFFVKETGSKIVRNESYWKNIIYGFRPSVIKTNKLFYISVAAICVSGIATQIFFPYFLIYLDHSLTLGAGMSSVVMGIAIFITVVFAVFFGRIVDKYGRDKLIYVSVAIFAVGLLLLFFVKTLVPVIIGGTIMLIGMTMVTIVLGAAIRNYTPSDKAGLFQGVKLIFTVLIPMIIGPQIGAAVCSLSTQTFVNEFNEVVKLPNSGIFLCSSIVAALIAIVVFVMQRMEARQRSSVNVEEVKE